MDTAITRARATGIAIAGAIIAATGHAQPVEPAAPPEPVAATPASQEPTASSAPAVPAEADNPADIPEVTAPRNRIIPPATPPVPPRAQAAVMRVLDKVTAETLAFAAPIGRRVRYKSLVFEVKTCVTRDPGEALPRPSAYLVITSDAGARARGVIGPRQVFKGWMFANAPGLNALKHPVYDAWLVSCNATAPGV